VLELIQNVIDVSQNLELTSSALASDLVIDVLAVPSIIELEPDQQRVLEGEIQGVQLSERGSIEVHSPHADSDVRHVLLVQGNLLDTLLAVVQSLHDNGATLSVEVAGFGGFLGDTQRQEESVLLNVLEVAASSLDRHERDASDLVLVTRQRSEVDVTQSAGSSQRVNEVANFQLQGKRSDDNSAIGRRRVVEVGFVLLHRSGGLVRDGRATTGHG
jgi:hypothetical protein